MTASGSTRSIFRPAVLLMSGRMLGFLAAFAIPIVLARVLDQSEFGTYKQLFLIFATFYGIAQLGMAESLFYFLPAAPRLGGRYALNAMLVLVAAGAACFVLLWVAQPRIADWLNNEALVGHLAPIGLFLLLMLASAVLEISMIAGKRHWHASGVYAFSDLARAAFLVVPVLWTGRLEWLLLGAIVFASLRFAGTLFYLTREFRGGFAPDVGLARRQLAYAAPFAVYALVEVAYTNLHLYAVSSRFDAATFAIYAVGCLSIPLVEFLMSSTANVMMVRMREDAPTGGSAAALALWRDTTRKLALLFVPLVGGLLVTANELIVGLYTGAYERSIPVFVVWTGTFLFSALLTDAVLRVYAQMRFLMLLSLFKLALAAAGIGWFLSMFGLLGAVLAMLVTVAAAKAIALARVKAVLQTTVAQLLPWRALALTLAIGAAAMLPALMAKSALGDPGLVSAFLAAGIVYGASYVGLLWAWGPVSGEEKQALIGRLQGAFASAYRSRGLGEVRARAAHGKAGRSG